MVTVNEVRTVKRAELNREYFPHGREIVLKEYALSNGESTYFNFIYDNADGVRMEYGQYSDYAEASSDFEDVMVTYF